MESCWKENPEERPSFANILASLKAIQLETTDMDDDEIREELGLNIELSDTGGARYSLTPKNLSSDPPIDYLNQTL